MVPIFCKVTAELSDTYLRQFPDNFDIQELLLQVSSDADTDVGSQQLPRGEVFFLQGTWINICRARDMLVSALMMYGLPASNHSETTAKSERVSGSLSALLEAAEALISSDLRDKHEQNVQLTEQTNNPESDECMEPKAEQYNDNQSLEDAETDTDNDSIVKKCSSGTSINSSDIKEEDFGNILSNFQDTATNSQCVLSAEEQDDTKQKNKIVEIQVTRKDKSDSENAKEDRKDSYFLVQLKPSNFETNVCMKCSVCDKVFKNVRSLNFHMKIHNIAYYKCQECGKKLKTFRGLEEHVKTHQTKYVRPEFKCEQCLKGFCNKSNLECHAKSEHLGMKKSFICHTCGKPFTTKHSLEEHINTHSGLRPHQCPECGKCFAYSAALRDHKFIHLETKTFICKFEECGKEFKQKSVLRMHEKIHRVPKQFECEECGRGFTQKQALKRHIRAHEGLRPFKCRICGRLFGDTAVVRRHLKHVHKLSKEVDKWKEDMVELSPEQLENNPQEFVLTSHETTHESAAKEVSSQNIIETQVQSTVSGEKQSSDKLQNIKSEKNISSNSLQSMFIDFNLTSSNASLEVPQDAFASSSQEEIDFSYSENKPEQIETDINQKQSEIHHKYSATPVDNNNTIESSPKLDLNPVPESALTEYEEEFIGKEPVQFLNENLDGTFTASVDFSKMKKNFDLLSKPSSAFEFSLSNDQASETLKPDGTEAEMPFSYGLEGVGRYGDMEPLAENLSLSHLQYFNSSTLTNSLNEYQSQGSNLSNSDADKSN